MGPLTDGELMMGAAEGRDHGVWLSVLEKAYAQIALESREQKTGAEIAPDDAVAADYIGHGGYSGKVIVLLSGHKTTGAPLSKWVRQDPEGGLEKADELLGKLTAEHKLMTAGTGSNKTRPLPKGIPHGHVFGLLEYNATNRTVTLFNPWGNHFKPSGTPGIVNGYPTEHGILEVPLADFIQIFGGITYETDQAAVTTDKPLHT